MSAFGMLKDYVLYGSTILRDGVDKDFSSFCRPYFSNGIA